MHENLGLLESPLRKIEEERSSQFSLSTSTAKFLLSSPEKENLGERTRPKENKLFTFYKISDPLKPRFSLSSNKNSLNLSNTSELGRIDEHGEPLFTNFQQEKEEREDLSDLHSISSIEIEEAEQVFPEELVPWSSFSSLLHHLLIENADICCMFVIMAVVVCGCDFFYNREWQQDGEACWKVQAAGARSKEDQKLMVCTYHPTRQPSLQGLLRTAATTTTSWVWILLEHHEREASSRV